MSVAELASGQLLARLVRALGRTAAQHAAFTQLLAAQLGISPTDIECLAVLQDLGPASAGQLAEVLGLTTGAITGVVDRLSAAGFVVREDDPSDRRRVIIVPVADRRAELDRRYTALELRLAQALGDVGDASLRDMLRFEHAAAHALQHETSSLRLESAPSRRASTFSAPLGEVTLGVLEFSAGAADVRLAAIDSARPELLFEASFEGPQPAVRAQDGNVTVRYARVGVLDWARTRPGGVVRLNPRIPWRVVVRGGASGLRLDATGLRLTEFRVSDGASKLELALPWPEGEVRICLDGGLNRADIVRPTGSPAQLLVQGGANRLEFDAQRFGAVGGEVRLATPGWDQAAGRYVIEARGGATRLSVHEA